MNVKFRVTPWDEDHATTVEDCAVLLVRGIEIDGEELLALGATLSLEGSEVPIEEGGIEPGPITDFLSLQVRGMQEAQFERLGPEQLAHGSTPDDAGLFVSSLEIEIV